MQTWNYVFYLTVTLVFIGLLYLLAPILTPFLIGILLAYLVNPLVNYLTRWRLSRLTSVIIVFIMTFLIIIVLILLLIPLIQQQIDTLIVMIPNAVDWLQNKLIPTLTYYLGTQTYVDINVLKTILAKQWSQAGSVAGTFFSTVVHSGFVLVTFFIDLLIIPVVTFYLLRDWKTLLKGIKNLIPRQFESSIVTISKECDRVLSAFFRGQLLVMLTIGIYYSIGLSLIGLKIGIILGLTIGLMSIVPYLGIIIGIITASIAAFLQFGLFTPVLFVWLLFAIGQVLDSIFITPQLVGERIGLHPLLVIFAVLAGGSLFGFFGVLLALPVSAVIMVWLRHLERKYQSSHLYK